MLLPARSPAEWLEAHLGAYFTTYADRTPPGQPGGAQRRPVGYDEVLDGLLERQAAEWLAEGIPGGSAGMYLAGWFPGSLAAWVAFALLGSGAAYLPDRSSLSWLLHPDGWADGVVLGPGTTVLVLPGHPWAGHAGVEVVASAEEQRGRLVEAVIEASTPIVDRIHELTRAGRVGLWHEVGDGFSGAVAYQQAFALRGEHVAVVEGLTRHPGAPWRRKPILQFVADDFGTWCSFQKGGCCQYYLEARALGEDPADTDPEDIEDEDHRAFCEAFPPVPGAPAYCGNCKFLPPGDVFARDRWWRRREALHPDSAAG